MNHAHTTAATDEFPEWPAEGHVRIPAWIYTDRRLFERELQILHYGDSWNYVALECEIPKPLSVVESFIAQRHVLAARQRDGEVAVAWNTCPACGQPMTLRGRHLGEQATLVCKPCGGKTMTLFGREAEQRLRRLRIESRGGAIWATFSASAPPLADFLGPEGRRYLDRVLNGRPLRLLGYDRQLLFSNWKLWFENTRDPYHATLLHTFFTTFGISRADGHHRSAHGENGRIGVAAFNYVGQQKTNLLDEMRTYRADLMLEDMETVSPIKEYDEQVYGALQVFPSMQLQFHLNIPAIRHAVPIDVNRCGLYMTYFGYADDDEEMQLRRLKQGNLTGAAGYVGIEDSEVLGMAQLALAGSPEAKSFIEMGGRGTEEEISMLTENLIRALYRMYPDKMGLRRAKPEQ